jgi:hypothetical protein
MSIHEYSASFGPEMAGRKMLTNARPIESRNMAGASRKLNCQHQQGDSNGEHAITQSKHTPAISLLFVGCIVIKSNQTEALFLPVKG